MPNRILRDWTDSDRFDGISADAERLFVRLLMKADDYGRFHAEPRRLRAALFPLVDNLRPNDLIRWLDELSTRQLILRYASVDDRQLLAILRFGQRLKQSVPKFPPPPGMTDDWLPDSGPTVPVSGKPPEVPGSYRKSPEVPARDGDGYGDEFGDDKRTRTRKRALGADALVCLGVSRQHADDWLAIRRAKRAPLTETAVSRLMAEAQKAGISVDEAVETSVVRGWQGFQAEWLGKPVNGTGPPKPPGLSAEALDRIFGPDHDTH